MNENNTLSQRLGVNIGIEGVNQFTEKLRDGYSGAKDSFKDITNSLNSEMEEALNKMKDGTASLFDSINDQSGQTGGVIQQTRDAVRDHVNDMGDSFKSVFNTTDLKQSEKMMKKLTKQVGKITSEYALMEDYTGISADTAVDFMKKVNVSAKSMEGEFDLYKSIFGIKDKKGMGKARLEMLKFLGDDAESFLEFQNDIINKTGLKAVDANKIINKSFLIGGNQISMDLKKKILPGIYDDYKELSEGLTKGVFDPKDFEAFSRAATKYTHVLMKSSGMNQEDAYATAKVFAELKTQMESGNLKNLAFNPDSIGDLVKDNLVLQQILGQLGKGGKDNNKLGEQIKKNGMFETLLKIKESIPEEKRGEFFKQFMPKLQAMYGDTMTDDMMGSIQSMITSKTRNTSEIISKVDKAQAKADKGQMRAGDLIKDKNKKHWRGQITTAEGWEDYYEKIVDTKLDNLTIKAADKFIIQKAKRQLEYANEAIDLAKTGDTYFTGSMIKRFSALKRMGVMGLFVDLDGGKQVTGINAQLADIAQSFGSVALNAAPAITAMNTMGIKFGGLGMVAKPFTSSFGMMNKATLGLAGNFTKLTGLAGVTAFGLSKLRKVAGDKNIMDFLSGKDVGDGNFMSGIQEGLAYDFTRVFLKKRMVFEKEYQKMSASQLKHEVSIGNRIIDNKTVNAAVNAKGNKANKARQKIFMAYGINLPNGATAKQIEAARKQIIDINRKKSFNIAEQEIKTRSKKFIQIIDRNLDFLGKMMTVVWDRAKINIFGGIDTNGDLVAPLYMKIAGGLNTLMGKLSNGKLFNKDSENVMSDKMKAILGLGVVGAFASPSIRGGFVKGFVGMISGSKKAVGSAMESLYKHGFKNRSRKTKILVSLGMIGAGAKLFETLNDPTKRNAMLGNIETILGLKPETLSVFSNFKSFFSDTLIPQMQTMIEKTGELFVTFGNFFMSSILPEIPGAIGKGVSVIFKGMWDNKGLMLKIGGIVTAIYAIKKGWDIMTTYVKREVRSMASTVKNHVMNGRGITSGVSSAPPPTGVTGFNMMGPPVNNGLTIPQSSLINSSPTALRTGGLRGVGERIRGAGARARSYIAGQAGRSSVGGMGAFALAVTPLAVKGLSGGFKDYFESDNFAGKMGDTLTTSGAALMMINPMLGAAVMIAGVIANVYQAGITDKRIKELSQKSFNEQLLKDKKLQDKIYNWGTDFIVAGMGDDEVRAAMMKRLKKEMLKEIDKKNLGKNATKDIISKSLVNSDTVNDDNFNLADAASTTESINNKARIKAAIKNNKAQRGGYQGITRNMISFGGYREDLKKEMEMSINSDIMSTSDAYSEVYQKAISQAKDKSKRIDLLNQLEKVNAGHIAMATTNDRWVEQSDKTLKLVKGGFNKSEYDFNFNSIIKNTETVFGSLSESTSFIEKSYSMLKNNGGLDYIEKKNLRIFNEIKMLNDLNNDGFAKNGEELALKMIGAESPDIVFRRNLSKIDDVIKDLSTKTGINQADLKKAYMKTFGSTLNTEFSSWKEMKDTIGQLDASTLVQLKKNLSKKSMQYKVGQLKSDSEYLAARSESRKNINTDIIDNFKTQSTYTDYSSSSIYGNISSRRDKVNEGIANLMFENSKGTDVIKNKTKELFAKAKGDRVLFEKLLKDGATGSRGEYVGGFNLKENLAKGDANKKRFKEYVDKLYVERAREVKTNDDEYQQKYSKARNAGYLKASILFENESNEIRMASEKTKSMIGMNMGLESTNLSGDITSLSYENKLIEAKSFTDNMSVVYTQMRDKNTSSTNSMAENILSTNKELVIESMGGIEAANQQLKGTNLDFTQFSMSNMNDFLSRMDNNQRTAFLRNLKLFKDQSSKLGNTLDIDLTKMADGVKSKVSNLLTDLSGGFLSFGKVAKLASKGDLKNAENEIGREKFKKRKAQLLKLMTSEFKRENNEEMTSFQKDRLRAKIDKNIKILTKDQLLKYREDSKGIIKRLGVDKIKNKAGRQKLANDRTKAFNKKVKTQDYINKKKGGIKGKELIGDLSSLANAVFGRKSDSVVKQMKSLSGGDNKISQTELDVFKSSFPKGRAKKNILANFNKLLAKKNEYEKVAKVEKEQKAVDKRIDSSMKNKSLESDIYTKNQIKTLVSNEAGVKMVNSQFSRLSNSLTVLIDMLMGSGINVKVVGGASAPKGNGKVGNNKKISYR